MNSHLPPLFSQRKAIGEEAEQLCREVGAAIDGHGIVGALFDLGYLAPCVRPQHSPGQPETGAVTDTGGINVAQAKKFFYDYLDRERPWNKPEFKNNMYAYMEELVARAALYFADEPLPTDLIKENRNYEQMLTKLTESLADHPKGWEGPCMCADCRSAG